MLAATVVFFGGIVVMLFFIIKRQRENIGLKENRFTESSHALQAELEKTADFVIRRLEERVQHLQYLIAEADERIIRLESQLEEADKKQVQGVCGKEKRTVVPSETVQRPRCEKTVQEGTDGFGEFNGQSLDIRTRVFSLLDEGEDCDAIAKQTGLGKGAITLLAQIHKKS